MELVYKLHRTTARTKCLVIHVCVAFRTEPFPLYTIWSKQKIDNLAKFVTARIKAVQGDPAHLDQARRKVQSTILSDGCPTDWDTHAFNDTSLTCMHNPNIMPYGVNDAEGPDSVQRRREMAYDNPATCDL